MFADRQFAARGLVLVVVLLALALPSIAEKEEGGVPVETFTLDNGMTFLLVPKPELTTIHAGWVAHVGAANEEVGQTGIAHFFEHMMFKGSKTLGTTNAERDLEIIAEQEALQERIREIYEKQRQRFRRGEIDDPFDPSQRPQELIELERRFAELVEEQRSLMVKDEFDQVYTKAGGSGMNAFTNHDMTVYFITVPANKLELWFWMESDRLYEPVRREFYAERDVVFEERRLRTESTPTGKFDEQFNAMFWQAHPYGRPVIGWPSDLRMYSKEQADAFYETYYAPNNLTGAIVGNFEIEESKKLAERYFGRLERRPEPPPMYTLEPTQLAEKRMSAACDCQPQIEIRYQSVPFAHRDSYPMQILANVMSGRTGRLYKSLVLDKEIASSAGANQSGNKYGGSFSFFAESKGEASPAELEAAIDAEIARIKEEGVPAEELQKIKNQVAAGEYRRLQSPFFLLIQLLYYDGLGDWRYINYSGDKLLAVTSEDVQRVAKTYLVDERRAVAHYTRKEGTAAEEIPEQLAGLPAPAQRQVMAQAKQVRALGSAEELGAVLDQLRAQKAAAPAQFHGAIEYLISVASEKLSEIEAAAEGGE